MQKKLKIFFFSLVILFVSCGIRAGMKSAIEQTTNYLPYPFKNIDLGMTISEFAAIKDTGRMERSNLMTFRREFTEIINKNEVSNATYYFDNDGHIPFYEIIIEFNEGFNVSEFAQKEYGYPNTGTEWLMDSKKGYNIRIWLFENKLVLAAEMKGTEWNENK